MERSAGSGPESGTSGSGGLKNTVEREPRGARADGSGERAESAAHNPLEPIHYN